ncbi:hypothetical protein Ciccas_004554 [Cichlidogyrus casuarinus]|uniref:Uncharacterized protein n=1 Tax=Cichlidogyrus casuarinus TaxID=1844966 RepID=A0ABD2QB74_9PLAT
MFRGNAQIESFRQYLASSCDRFPTTREATPANMEALFQEHEALHQSVETRWKEAKHDLLTATYSVHEGDRQQRQSQLTQLHDQWLEKWTQHREHYLVPRLNYALRLSDLADDLNECRRLMLELIANSSAFCQQKQLAPSVSEQELKQMHHCESEAKGMLDTVPVSAKDFIHTLAKETREATGNEALAQPLQQIDQLWDTYREDLKRFEAFVEYLTRSLRLLPKSDWRKLEKSLRQALDPIKTPLAALAKEVEQIPEERTRLPVDWLLQQLASAVKETSASLDEAELLIANNRPQLQSEVIEEESEYEEQASVISAEHVRAQSSSVMSRPNDSRESITNMKVENSSEKKTSNLLI